MMMIFAYFCTCLGISCLYYSSAITAQCTLHVFIITGFHAGLIGQEFCYHQLIVAFIFLYQSCNFLVEMFFILFRMCSSSLSSSTGICTQAIVV